MGGEVVDGDMEIVDIHSVGINLGGASGKSGKRMAWIKLAYSIA